MADQMQGQSQVGAEERILVRVKDSAYAVPPAVLERHRIPEERRAELAAALRERAGVGEAPAEAPLFELPEETLDAYRLSDDERTAFEAQQAGRDGDARGFGHMGGERNPWPIDGYTGFHRNEFFGGFQRDQYGRSVFIGVFPMYRAPVDSSQPYPGLR